VLATLASFGEGHARELSLQDFDEAEGAVRVIEDFPLDIFTVMRGESYGDLVDYLRQTKINGAKIDFLNADGLIRLKADLPREKDRIDIAALRKRTVGEP
jgi:hypothetical protein